jgi:hypothetical protein
MVSPIITSDLSLAEGKYLVPELIPWNVPGPQAAALTALSVVVPRRFAPAVSRHGLHLATLAAALQAAGVNDEIARDLVERALDSYRHSLMNAIEEERASR